MTALREQIDAWAERYAIASTQPDVTEQRARELADCERGAEVHRALGLALECTCGAHPWRQG